MRPVYECEWLPTMEKPPDPMRSDVLWTFELANFEHRYHECARPAASTGDASMDTEAINLMTILNDKPGAGWNFPREKERVRGPPEYEHMLGYRARSYIACGSLHECERGI